MTPEIYHLTHWGGPELFIWWLCVFGSDTQVREDFCKHSAVLDSCWGPIATRMAPHWVK